MLLKSSFRKTSIAKPWSSTRRCFLDAAECFLALQQTEDARRMANYLLTEYAPSLSSDEAERAGDVLFKAGDEDNARKAYELPLSKLREGH